MKITNKASVVAGAVLVALATGAAAGETVNHGTVRIEQRTVRFADLDLDKPAGIAALHVRLRLAASQACGTTGAGLSQWNDHNRCRTDALEEAISRLPAQVQAFHAHWVKQGSKWLARPDDGSAVSLLVRKASR